MQSSFGVNMLALNHGRPEQMGLRRLLEAFLEFREEVVVRRVKFELAKARDRGHVLVGLAVAVANIDEVIHIIRSSADPTEARERPRMSPSRRAAVRSAASMSWPRSAQWVMISEFVGLVLIVSPAQLARAVTRFVHGLELSYATRRYSGDSKTPKCVRSYIATKRGAPFETLI
jgi:hypothetical protein